GLLLLLVAPVLPAQPDAPYDYLQLTPETLTQVPDTGADADTGDDDGSATAPAPDNTQLLATIADYQAQLNALRDAAGPFSGDQVEVLDSLADLYQQAGDHTSALAS